MSIYLQKLIFIHIKKVWYSYRLFFNFFHFSIFGNFKCIFSISRADRICKSLGIDIEDLRGDLEDDISGIGQPMEEFTFELPEQEEKEDLKTYLGFRGDVSLAKNFS